MDSDLEKEDLHLPLRDLTTSLVTRPSAAELAAGEKKLALAAKYNVASHKQVEKKLRASRGKKYGETLM